MAEKLEKACQDAKAKLSSLRIEEQLVSEIEWCLGSYSSDGNPIGLSQKAEIALNVLETYKKSKPKKVSKKLIDQIQKALKNN